MYGGVEAYLHYFLLDGDDWLESRFVRFAPTNIYQQYSYITWLGGF
jgi:hypothetical protein